MNKVKLIGAVAATCASLAACGGSSAPSLSTFKSGFTADQTQFRQYGTQLGAAITGAASKTDSQLAAELTALAGRAKQQATQLGKLDPPAKFKPQIDRLTSAFGAISSDLTQISAAAAKHDAKGAEAATRTLVADATKVKSADTALSGSLGLKTPAA